MSKTLIVNVGMLVAVNDLPEGQVYTVEERNGFGVRLSYDTARGKVMSSGWMDVCSLQRPTQDQLINEIAKSKGK